MTTTTEPATAQEPRSSETQHVDVLIVGAGVSGIGAAHHLQERFPDRSFVILDAQDNRGGTWWTHRYPGVRSDSDLFTGPGSSHALGVERAEEFLPLVQDFLAEHPLT